MRDAKQYGTFWFVIVGVLGVVNVIHGAADLAHHHIFAGVIWTALGLWLGFAFYRQFRAERKASS